VHEEMEEIGYLCAKYQLVQYILLKYYK